MMLAKAESLIGICGLEDSSSLMRSPHGKTGKGEEDQLSFILFNTKACILKGLRSVAFKSLSDLEEQITTLGSNFPRRERPSLPKQGRSDPRRHTCNLLRNQQPSQSTGPLAHRPGRYTWRSGHTDSGKFPGICDQLLRSTQGRSSGGPS